MEVVVKNMVALQDLDTVDKDQKYAAWSTYYTWLEAVLKGQDKVIIFARLHPENICAEDIYLDVDSSKVIVRKNLLITCVKQAEISGKSIGVILGYREHCNILWFNTKEKTIDRFEPQIPRGYRDQKDIDDLIRVFLRDYFPNYVYMGNVQDADMCPQRIRRKLRISSDAFCSEYSMLYAIRRIRGMSHLEAIFDLIQKINTIPNEVEKLLLSLISR